MKELSTKHRRFGLPRLHFLLKREGLVVSHHRSERVYRKLRLQLKNKDELSKWPWLEFRIKKSHNAEWNMVIWFCFWSFPKLPNKLRCDNGPEMSSKEFMDWAYRNNIAIEYIQPGKPVQNAFIESCNSRFRDECLNEELFFDLADAKKKIEKWRKYYNEERPHSSIGMKTPNAFEKGLTNSGKL